MTKSTLQILLAVVVIIALAATAYAVSIKGKVSSLEQQLNVAQRQNDSLNNLVKEQDKLLEAEGIQFQNDLLKIDSLENQRK